MSITLNPTIRLTSILYDLSIQAKQIDKVNKQNKAHSIIEENQLFSFSLFHSDSDKLIPYIEEVESNIQSLNRLISTKKNALATVALEKIEFQIQALLKAINSNKSMHDDAQVHLEAKYKAIKAHKFKKTAQKIIQSSQSLYKKLSEHHEFERRLLDMLSEQELTRTRAKSTASSNKATQEILILHQRLGRCRKAISTIERDIEFSEKRV
jgi:primosomal replication protein N''